MLRRLHNADRRVAEERHRPLEKARSRHEVGVENGDEFGRIWKRREEPERVVDIAGLGVPVVGPGHVSTAKPSTQIFEPIAPAVVEHPDAEIRIVDRHCADDRPFENRPLFVVRADQDIDERIVPIAFRAIRRSRRRRPIDCASGRETAATAQRQACRRPPQLERRARSHTPSSRPDAGNVAVIRHQAYWAMMARLITIDDRAARRRRLRPNGGDDEKKAE